MIKRLGRGNALQQLLQADQRQPCGNGSCQLCAAYLLAGEVLDADGKSIKSGEVLCCQAEVTEFACIRLLHSTLLLKPLKLYCKILARQQQAKTQSLELLIPAGRHSGLSAGLSATINITQGRLYRCHIIDCDLDARHLRIELPDALANKIQSDYLKLQVSFD